MAVPVAMEEEDDEVEEEEQSFNIPPDLHNLLTAAELGNADELSHALGELCVSVDAAGEDGDTALHFACLYGHIRCVQMLLEAGASIEVKDEDGAIPLHDACAGGYVEIVKVLLAAAKGDEQKIKRLLATTDIDGDAPCVCVNFYSLYIMLLVVTMEMQWKHYSAMEHHEAFKTFKARLLLSLLMIQLYKIFWKQLFLPREVFLLNFKGEWHVKGSGLSELWTGLWSLHGD